jgi:2-oxo-3-hexenedioate decarboxylase
MVKKNLDSLATMLHEARAKGSSVPQLSKSLESPLTRSESYLVQEKQLQLRLQGQGGRKPEIQIGWKMGLTSEAKRKQMNLDSPLYGYLTDKMQVEHRGVFYLHGSIHPKIEPEIAFKISKDLKAPINRQQVLSSCSAVAACMEILDSRYEQFKYFSMEDVIADNSSSSHFVCGPWVSDFKHIDFMNLKMQMFVNDEIVQTGMSNDISGDPVISVIQLCELLAERGQTLRAGSIVLAGAATPAVELKAGQQVLLQVDLLPEVKVSIKD